MREQTINAALETATQARSTSSSTSSPKRLDDDCYNFVKLNRAGEGTETMVREVIRFLNGMKGHCEPYILTLSGKSGTGKTHCAKAISRWYNSGGSSYLPRVDGCWFLKWGRCLEEARSGNYEYLRNPVRYAGLLIVDEIGGDMNTQLEKNLLFRLVDERMHKWTLLTTNQSIKSIARDVDYRVASRLVRDENVLVENNDPDWCAMKWKANHAG